jgi:glycosyltransferase involved in cell wall biosynthesis
MVRVDAIAHVDRGLMMSQPRQLVFANSLDYARLTGGFVYNTRLMRELAMRGWEVLPLDLPAGFPRPDAEAKARSAGLLAALSDDALVIADQICFSPLTEVLAREAQRLRFVMIFHHPIAMEEGLPADERARFMAAERAALACCRMVVVSSRTTAATLIAGYGVPEERIILALPGIERLPAAEPPTAVVPRLLSVGAVIPRKGYHDLIEALAGLTNLPWSLGIVGDLERAPDYVARLRESILAVGLNERVVLRGGIAPPELDGEWRSAHVFVAASLHEGYGMAVAEAIARGLPTVTTGAGAVREWLDPAAALIVPERSPEALRDAIRRVLTEPSFTSELRAAALAQAARFPSWSGAAAAVDERLSRL